jgi:hypothetical protein
MRRGCVGALLEARSLIPTAEARVSLLQCTLGGLAHKPSC